MSKYKVDTEVSPDLPTDATELEAALDSVWNQVVATVEPSYFTLGSSNQVRQSGKKPKDADGWFVMDTNKRVSRA